MISCLLIQVSRNQHGLPVRQESTIVGVSIQIGRGAACKIHLLDHRVDLHHATLRRSDDGLLYIEGEGEATLKVNGFVEQNASLQPGTRIEIGPYLLVVETVSDGHDIVLSVETIQPPPGQGEAKACRVDPLTLDALGLSKRKLGFALAVWILLFFMLLPMLPSISPALDKWQTSLPLTLTGSWSPGSMSGGHGLFAEKCSSCHQHPFRAVQDEACSGCHKDVERHMGDDALHAGLFKDLRCADCHVDHKGEAGLMPYDSSRCVACHANIKKKSPAASITDIHSFSADHPPFRIALRNGKDGEQVIRVRQDVKEQVSDKPGLKYSHRVHLDKAGVSSPQGDTVMACRDCHRLGEAGTHFEPMSMKKTCQQSDCHGQDFTAPVEGEVPHGSEREVMIRLRGYFTKWLADSPEYLAECDLEGVPGSQAQRSLLCADELARKNAAASLFRKDLECGECHEIEASDNPEVPWKISPVRINRDWHAGSVFPHNRHDTMGCEGCHDKENSESSADISMPNIGKCRECHVGDRPLRKKVGSTCYSCHRFHGGADAADPQ